MVQYDENTREDKEWIRELDGWEVAEVRGIHDMREDAEEGEN